MLYTFKIRSAIFTLILTASSLLPAQAQTLKADYQFQNTLHTSQGTAPPLGSLGENHFAMDTVKGQRRSILEFVEGNGVALPTARNVIPGDTYSIVVLFRFATTTSWRRLLDFKNGTTDTGLYSKDGRLQFYSVAIGADVVIQPNTFTQVMLTRDHQKNVCGYVDGKLQFTFLDQNDEAVISDANTLRFFRDDGTEHSAGAVARIRIYDAPLTVAQASPLHLTLRPTPIPTRTPNLILNPTRTLIPGPLFQSAFIRVHPRIDFPYRKAVARPMLRMNAYG